MILMIIKGTSTYVVSHPATDGCTFSLPGYGGLRGTLCADQYRVWACVMENYDTYIGIIDGSVYTDHEIFNNVYECAMVVNKTNWEWTWTDAGAQVPSGGILIERADITVGDGDPNTGKAYFRWTFPTANAAELATGLDVGSDPAGYFSVRNLKYIGKAQDFGFSDERDGYCYISGTGVYPVNDPVYPTPIQIPLPGFREIVVPPAPSDYFPGASRASGAWASQDTGGRGDYMRASGAWSERKNTDATGTVYVRKNGAWALAPKQ